MKRSNTWSALILIASALLLSAGKSGAQNLRPRPSVQIDATLPDHRNSAANDNQTPTNPSATTVPKQAPSPTHPEVSHDNADEVKNVGKDRLHEWADWLLSIIKGSTQGLFNFLIMLATLFLAKFTYQLVHADRPFLIPEKQALSGQWPSLAEFENGMIEVLTAQMTLRNCGKGPAILDDAVGRLMVVDRSFLPPADKFDDCYALIITPTNAFAAGETTDCISPHLDARQLTREELQEIWDDKKWLIFYGKITYHDIFKANYNLTFLYAYQYPAGFILKGYFYPPRNAVGFNKFT